jgi:hypothetical protein
LLADHGYAIGTDSVRPNVRSLTLVKQQYQLFDIEHRGTKLPQKVIEAYNLLNCRSLERTANATSYDQFQEPGADAGTYREVFLTATREDSAAAVAALNEAAERVQEAEDEVENLRDSYGDEYWRNRLRRISEGTWSEALKEEEAAIRAGDVHPAEGQFDYVEAVDRLASAHHELSVARVKAGFGWKDGHAAYAGIANPIVRVRFNVRTTPGRHTEYRNRNGTATKAEVRLMLKVIALYPKTMSFAEMATQFQEDYGPRFTVKLRRAFERTWKVHRGEVRCVDDVGRTRIMFLEEVQPPSPDQQERMPPVLRKHWREIAFKWALRYAAENGLDAVAWTTGEMQAKRYSLEEEVQSISWGVASLERETRFVSIKVKYSKTRIQFFVGQDGRVVSKSLAHHFEGELLEDVVGKEIAKQIRTSPRGRLPGEGLSVGGVGLKRLYDVDFPNVVNNLRAVKRAGVKVDVARVGSDESALQPELAMRVPSIQITRALRDALLNGQPLFQ